MSALPKDITMATGLEGARLAVPLRKIGRTDSEKGRICEGKLRPKDEAFWSEESEQLRVQAAAVVDNVPAIAVVDGVHEPATLPHPIYYPILYSLDAQIARLVISKEKSPLPDLTIKDLPSSVRSAEMDPIAAEQLLVLAQVRRVIELLEIAVVRRDYVGTENATRGLAMRIAGVALLSMQGARARQDYYEEFFLKYEWQEIMRVLNSKHMERPLVDTKDRNPL